MNKGFFIEALKNKILFSAIVDFNTKLLQQDTEKSFIMLEKESPLPITNLSPNILKKYIQKDFSNHKQGFWDFAEETRRLALLDTKTLHFLMLIMGVTLNAKQIAKTITKNEVINIKNYIGEPLYFYALTRGQYRLGTLCNMFNNTLPLTEKIQKNGEQALAHCIKNWPTELKNIFLSMHTFPSSFIQTLNEIENHSLTPMDDILLWFSIKKILIKEVHHSWNNYFN